ncbi:nuclear pore complex protein NUP98A-like isoform X2 [Ceratina calcarata]|uniref:Nucleoporin NUP42 n=1 Tax=Ceratina calcarata TaxID=156304 RepID=A0AAJ7IZD7_9HYME|nr:nuclear pore complex protein NUP98A-like isoform X2 [Ceratina calcarata]
MVICKYYQQGHCRFGQYCQFEHINTFGKGRDNKDSYNEDEYTVVLVAKEVLNAERGGQWMLSCFAPLKEKPCIPGMEDVSPEEVRWEMYQAEKNGMSDQAKLHYQQMCRDMKTKREALKNPTRETLNKLKEILGTGHKNKNENASGKSSNFAFATPQLGNPSSNPSSNVFHSFSGGMTPSTNASSIFGRPATTTNPVFGQSAQTFGSGGSIFGGGTSQPVFGQSSMFGSQANQSNNVFARPQTSQTTTSVFNSGTTSSSPLFSGTSQSANASSIFGGAKTSTANLFGGPQTTNSIFGGPSPTGNFSSGMFNSQSETPAFGGTSVFGAAPFGNASNSIFGEKPAFGASTGMFGASSTTQPTNAFGVTAPTPAVNLFGSTQGAQTAMPVSSAPPFGVTSTTTGPFVTAASQFETASTTVFSKPAFGTIAPTTVETFGTVVTSSNTPFGAPNTAPNTPFASPTFGEVKSSPFGSTGMSPTTNSVNQQQQLTSPFGNFAQNQSFNTLTASNGPFGNSQYGITATIIDDSVYSQEDQLTNDDKNMFLAEKFTFGMIPLRPPTKDIR